MFRSLFSSCTHCWSLSIITFAVNQPNMVYSVPRILCIYCYWFIDFLYSVYFYLRLLNPLSHQYRHSNPLCYENYDHLILFQFLFLFSIGFFSIRSYELIWRLFDFSDSKHFFRFHFDLCWRIKRIEEEEKQSRAHWRHLCERHSSILCDVKAKISTIIECKIFSVRLCQV